MLNIIIIIICSVCGYCVGKFFENRVACKGMFYRDLLRYLDMLKLNVTTKQVELDEFNEQFCCNSSQVFSFYVNSGESSMKLSASEKTEIENFFSAIKRVNSAELLKNIEYYSKVFSGVYNDSVEPEIKKSSVYSKLGILCGVIVGILLL